MRENGYKKMEDVLTQTWWNHTRFSRFGDILASTFGQDPAIRQKVTENFRCHNNKLSYFDFFNHVEFDFKAKLTVWELDALESRLDRLGFAFIEYWEFVEFGEMYGIEFDEPERPEQDTEAIMEAKLNISYKDYKLTKNDYFNGIKTILTSEKAALAKCH